MYKDNKYDFAQIYDLIKDKDKVSLKRVIISSFSKTVSDSK